MHAAPIRPPRSRALAVPAWIVAVIAVVTAPASLLPALADGASAAAPAGRFRLAGAGPAPALAAGLGRAPSVAGGVAAAPVPAGGLSPAPSVAGAVRSARAVGSSRVPELRPPVDGPLLRGFELAAGPFGPGHRGVDLGAAPGTPVRAPANGRVTFAGPVAGTTWVTVEVAPAVRVTLGPLRTLESSVGRVVAGGDRLGTLAGGHAGADQSVAALHLGLRMDGIHVDPLPWLAGLARPRLAPLPEPGGPH